MATEATDDTARPLNAGSPATNAGVLLVRPERARAPRRQAAGTERLRRALAEMGLAAETLVARGDPDATGEAVRSAVARLAERSGGARARIGVIAAGQAADGAVVGAGSDGRVQALALLSGRLGGAAKQTLLEWPQLPLLCIVSAEDRSAVRDATDAYLGARRHHSDIRILEDVGSGPAMMEGWAARATEHEPLETSVAAWMRDALAPGEDEREVSVLSEDGWEIHGDLLLPETRGERVPGVVLLHSGRSDREVFGTLARVLTRHGFAVAAIDWRGRGRSIGKGTYFDLSAEERARAGLDAKAAVDFLAAQDIVDGDRIGIVGIVHGAEYAVRGSIGDQRVKALVLLTGYMPASDAERAHLGDGGPHVMYVTCEGHGPVTETMRALYAASSDRLTRLHVYPGGAIGYQLFKLDDALEGRIVAWLEEALA